MSVSLSSPLRSVEVVHQRHVAGRRVRVLSEHLAEAIPADSTVLDVGCGDGEIAWTVGKLRPDLDIRGVDVLVRPGTRIPVEPYDGATLPYADNSYDVVTLVDVLHHCDQPVETLREATRVARRAVVIKDHLRQGFAGRQTLRFMDWVGNHRYGVALPYNYLSPAEWQSAFAEVGATVEWRRDRLGLYPAPFSLLFDRRLHFVARLGLEGTSAGQSPS
ncbi:MAG: methyltransferase domain-containing protein [Planctomycetota bacterium]